MQNIYKAILTFAAVLMVVYQAIASQHLYFGQWEHQTIHLLFIFILTFLSIIFKTQNKLVSLICHVCILIGIIGCAYVYLNIEELEATQGYPSELSVIVGCCLIVITMIGTYLSWGLPLLVVALTFVLYFFFGHHLEGVLYHTPFDFDYIISFLCIGLSGMYGMFLSISSDQVFLFIVFGALLSIFKVDTMFMEIGKILGRYMSGGPGMTAVMSNALIGMVSGAPVASVAITGPFVLPYMRQSGYTDEESGGIVACAATGGQLMPPVMGAAAFMMATFIGEPYSVVMIAAIIPAVLFYLAVGFGVQSMAAAKGFRRVAMDVNWALIGRRIWVFILPIGLIFYMLLQRYSPAMTAFWASVVTMVVGFASKETRPSFDDVLTGLRKGAVTGAKIGISLVLIGLVAQTLISTGMGTKLASLINMIAEGRLFIALLVTMVIALILGCAVPPAAAYALCAIVVVPTLTPMGVGLLEAHMYCFYFSIISAVTPPVGLASLAASGITGASYGTTSLHAFRLSLIGFILPFMLIYNPLFTFNTANMAWFATSPLTILISVVGLSVICYGALFQKTTFVEYLLAAATTLLACFHIFYGGHCSTTTLLMITGVTLALGLAFCASQMRRSCAAAAA